MPSAKTFLSLLQSNQYSNSRGVFISENEFFNKDFLPIVTKLLCSKIFHLKNIII